MRLYLFLLVLVSAISVNAQSMLEMLEQENKAKPDTIYAIATFKSIHLINSQTVETVGKNGLDLIISHRFGNVNTGVFDFFGLDLKSDIRIGLEYGATDRLDFGIGRSSEEKLYDSNFKFKILRQSSGAVNMPISVSWYSSMAINTDHWPYPDRNNLFTSRLFYAHELIIARKFNDQLSLQIVPGAIHRNLVETKNDENIIAFTGVGARYKLTKRLALSSEYYYIISPYTAQHYINPLSIGIDIETGGHVFQLHFSNSKGLHEKIMIPENTNDWLKGQFGFGFNICRNFDLSKKTK